jgi:hypothetical protein
VGRLDDNSFGFAFNGGGIEQSVCTSIYRVSAQAHQNSTEILKDAGVALTRTIVLES